VSNQLSHKNDGGSLRISFITNIIPPYRETFYRKLNSLPAIDWCFVRGDTTGEQGRLATRNELSIPTARVENREWRLGTLTLRWQKGVLPAVSRHEPDIVIVLGMPGNFSNWLLMAYCKLNKIPVLMWACGWEPQRPFSLAWRIKQIFGGLYYGMADRVLTYSSKGAKYVEELGVSSRNVSVCYNGIEIEHLLLSEETVRNSATQLRLSENIGSRRLLLFVGAMLADKRIDLVLRAQKALEDEGEACYLWLVGDGPARAQLERLATDLELRYVKFWGRKISDVDDYFAASDIVVLPGIGGLALNQAMFWRKPCIVSVADGTEDDLVLDQITGRRFESDNLESLLKCLREAIRIDTQTLNTWGEAGRALITKRSNVDVMVDTFHKAILEIASLKAALLK
jgi:glycosyltransferase involved in cell wall biosynthesis